MLRSALIGVSQPKQAGLPARDWLAYGALSGTIQIGLALKGLAHRACPWRDRAVVVSEY